MDKFKNFVHFPERMFCLPGQLFQGNLLDQEYALPCFNAPPEQEIICPVRMAKKDFSSVFTFSIRQDITDSPGQPMGQSIIFYRLLLASQQIAQGFVRKHEQPAVSMANASGHMRTGRLEQIFKAGIHEHSLLIAFIHDARNMPD